jgi:hypothetical protein
MTIGSCHDMKRLMAEEPNRSRDMVTLSLAFSDVGAHTPSEFSYSARPITG